MSIVTVANNKSATLGSGTAASPLTALVGNNATVTGGDYVLMFAGNSDSITLGDNCGLVVGNRDASVIGDNDFIVVGNRDTITAGSNDTIIAGNNNQISFAGGTLYVNSNDVITLADNAVVAVNGLGSGDVIYVGAKDTITFGAGETVTINGTGETITASKDDVITVVGVAAGAFDKCVVSIGANTTGATFIGTMGLDTFSPGVGYVGGNHYTASAQSNANLFAAFGSCINYAALNTAVTVNLNTQTGIGTGPNGSWTDTYTNMQQAKASSANGNVLTGSNTIYSEIKGGVGSVTFYGGAAGDRVAWSSADLGGTPYNGVGALGSGADIAYAGTGSDEFYWRNQPGKGWSNGGETIYGFNSAPVTVVNGLNVGGDDLNFSELTTAGFSGVPRSFNATASNGVVGDLFNWVAVAADGSGGTNVLFDKQGDGAAASFHVAVDLKGVDLFGYDAAAFHGGVTQSEQTVVQDLYAHGTLVFNHTI